QARAYLEKTLEQEAEEKIANNRRLLSVVEGNMEAYNSAVSNINGYLQAMQLYDHLLPEIGNADFIYPNPDSLDTNGKFATNGFVISDGLVDEVAKV
ncbi:MAG: dynamin family protein, partial [Nostoc sp.]